MNPLCRLLYNNFGFPLVDIQELKQRIQKNKQWILPVLRALQQELLHSRSFLLWHPQSTAQFFEMALKAWWSIAVMCPPSLEKQDLWMEPNQATEGVEQPWQVASEEACVSLLQVRCFHDYMTCSLKILQTIASSLVWLPGGCYRVKSLFLWNL